jgi:hypothetical protein
VGVEADRDHRGSDPARELDELVRASERHGGLLLQLADGGQSVRAVAVALLRVDRATREDPHSTHEAGLGRALDEEQFESLRGAAQEDHACRLTGPRRWSVVQLLTGSRTLRSSHRLTLHVGNLGRMAKTTGELAE